VTPVGLLFIDDFGKPVPDKGVVRQAVGHDGKDEILRTVKNEGR